MTTKYGKAVNRVDKLIKKYENTAIKGKNKIPLVCVHQTNYNINDAFKNENRGGGYLGRGFYFGLNYMYYNKKQREMKNTFCCFINAKKVYDLARTDTIIGNKETTVENLLLILNIKELNTLFNFNDVNIKIPDNSVEMLFSQIINHVYNLHKNINTDKLYAQLLERFNECIRSNGYTAIIGYDKIDGEPILNVFNLRNNFDILNKNDLYILNKKYGVVINGNKSS